jgi:hypothetical protein
MANVVGNIKGKIKCKTPRKIKCKTPRCPDKRTPEYRGIYKDAKGTRYRQYVCMTCGAVVRKKIHKKGE